MSDEVVITMTAQEASMVAAWQKARKNVQDFDKAVEEAAKKLAKAGKVGDESFGGMQQTIESAATSAITRLGGILSIVGAMRTAMQLFNQEWDELNTKQQDALQAQVGVSASFRRAAAVSRELSPQALADQIIGGAAGLNPSDLFQAFETASAAAGDAVTGQQLADLVLQTAKQRPDLDTSTRGSLATAALQLQKTFGGDAQTAVAAVQQSFGTSRAENLGAFSKAVVPTVTDLAAQGGGKDSFRDLMGLTVGFGQRTNDPTGDRTRTALASLAKQARETAITKGLVGKDASVLESIEAIRGNAKVQSELLGVFAQQTTGKSAAQLKRDMKKGTLTAEAAQFQAAVELFQGGDNATTRAIAGATNQNLGMTPQAVAEIAARQAAINATPIAINETLTRIGTQQKNAEMLNNPFANQAVMKNIIAQQEQAMGVNQLGRTLNAAALDFANQTRELTPADRARIAANQINATRGTTLRQADAGAVPLPTNIMLTKEDIKAAMSQQPIIDALREIADNLDRQNGRPQKVVIEGDNRPQPPRRAPVNGAGD